MAVVTCAIHGVSEKIAEMYGLPWCYKCVVEMLKREEFER